MTFFLSLFTMSVILSFSLSHRGLFDLSHSILPGCCLWPMLTEHTHTHIVSWKLRLKNIRVKPMAVTRLVIPVHSFSANTTLVAQQCRLACLLELLFQMSVRSNNVLKSHPCFFLVGFLEDGVTKGAAYTNMDSCLLLQMLILQITSQKQLNLSFRVSPILSSYLRSMLKAQHQHGVTITTRSDHKLSKLTWIFNLFCVCVKTACTKFSFILISENNHNK